MRAFEFRGFLAEETENVLNGVDLLEAVHIGGSTWLLAGSVVTGGVSRLLLRPDVAADYVSTSWALGGTPRAFADAGFETLSGDDRLISVDGITGVVTALRIQSNGVTDAPIALRTTNNQTIHATSITTHDDHGKDFLINAQRFGDGIEVHQLTGNWQAQRLSTFTDTVKSTLSQVSEILSVSVGSKDFVIAASDTESGLTSFEVSANGSLTMTDSISARDGLWVSGLNDLVTYSIDGVTYLVGSSAGSSTLSSVRLNPMGVFFVEDVESDSRDTRFANAAVVEDFAVNGRHFAITGGTDGGVSLFELLPDGELYHHSSTEMSLAWNIGSVAAIEAVVFGDEIQLLVSGTGAPGLAQLRLDMSDLGWRQTGDQTANGLTGSVLDDVLMGEAGNDTLIGNAGDDLIFAGEGRDTLTGGAGADIFAFDADRIPDLITDFEKGEDKIDLSGWGVIYHHSALSISAHDTGVRIDFAREQLIVEPAAGHTFGPSDWGSDDFVF